MPYTGAPQQGSPYTAAYGAPQQEAPKSSVDMGGAFKKAIDHIKNTVKKPITAAEEYYENGTIPSSAVLIGILTIAYVFATVLNLISKIFMHLVHLKSRLRVFTDYWACHMENTWILLAIPDGIFLMIIPLM